MLKEPFCGVKSLSAMPCRWVLINVVILFIESEVRRAFFQVDSSSSLLSQATSSKYISFPFMIGGILGSMVLLGWGVLVFRGYCCVCDRRLLYILVNRFTPRLLRRYRQEVAWSETKASAL